MVSPDEAQGTTGSGEANAPQQPSQEATPQADVNELRDQLTQQKKQLSEFISNASKREGELTRERDAMKKALEYGEDSPEYQTWIESRIREDEREQGKAQLAGLELENAKMRLLQQHPTVPESALEGATSPMHMENMVLRYERERGITGAIANSGEHPLAPSTMTSGGTGAGVGKSYAEIRDAYNIDPQANRDAYLAARKARGL
jgi:hypothetical protein